ncbi:MAG: DUF4396 domain-containing protein [Rhodobacteraceae bacterium]|nr:DUF4396 domain-containing protein [Paracoccaceae bacterium]
MIEILSDPFVLAIWVAAMLASLAIVVWDLSVNNSHLMSLMKLVWTLTVLYSGPLGLAIYCFSGRKSIATDSELRRGFRSVAHCCSGCGMGEFIGVSIAVGLFSLANWPTAAITFVLACLFGFGLTVGPMMQDGATFANAARDALIAETPSIAVMEIVALAADLNVAGNATMADVIFWSSLILSLSCGLIAAWPVNVALIHWGVKKGMMDPRMADHAHSSQHALG